jgi:hypothetical protein
MNNLKSFMWMFATVMLASMMFMSCTKEGPAGLPGKDGTNGKDGENGINGQDGTATCAVCHDNSEGLFTASRQWEASLHATGGHFVRNNGECAICHTSQGFLGHQNGTYDYTATGAIINNPNPPNCYTCHSIHATYTESDWALTVTGAITMNNTEETFDFGKGSLCASCHQGRTVSNFPTVGGPDITVANSRYHMHYGTQANMITGLSMFNIGEGLNNSLHTALIPDQCVTCHMTTAYGYESGGHAMYLRNASGTLNTAGCTDCHSDNAALVASVTELQTQVSALLDELKAKLDASGITAAGSDNTIAGTYPAVVGGAAINYRAVKEDKSLGVHNPTYTVKLLQNTIAALP